MNNAFYIGVTGLHSQQRALDVAASNISNMNTTAFKRAEVRFSELVQPAPAAGLAPVAAPAELAIGGVSVDASGRSFAQGDLRATGNPLDLAISGEGWVELLGPEGRTMLWRGGSLGVNQDGFLAAANGMPLKAMVAVPEGTKQIAISGEGRIVAAVEGEAEPVEIGQLDLVMTRNPASLTAVEGGLFEAPSDEDLVTARPGEEGAGLLVQGSLESSNVSLSEEMVGLLLVQRAYAANAQVVQAGDQLMSIANGLKR